MIWEETNYNHVWTVLLFSLFIIVNSMLLTFIFVEIEQDKGFGSAPD